MKSNKKNSRAAATPPLSVQELQSAMTPTRMIRKNSEMSAISTSSNVQQTREVNANKQADKKALAKLNMQTVTSNAEKARQLLLLDLLNPANNKSEVNNTSYARTFKTNQNVNHTSTTNQNSFNGINALTVEEMGLLKPTVKRQKTLPSGAHIKRRPRSIAPRYNGKQQQQQEQRYTSSPYSSELTRNIDSNNKNNNSGNDTDNKSNAFVHLTNQNSNVCRNDVHGGNITIELPMNVCLHQESSSNKKLNTNSDNDNISSTMTKMTIRPYANDKDSYGDDLRGVQHVTNNESNSSHAPSHLREGNALRRYNAPVLRPSLMTLYGSTSELSLKNTKPMGSVDSVNLMSSGNYTNEMNKESAKSDKGEQTSSVPSVNRAAYSRCMSSLSEMKETYHVSSTEPENYSKTRRRCRNSRSVTKRNITNNNNNIYNNNNGRESAMSLYSTNSISNATSNSKVINSTPGVINSMYTPIVRYNSEYNEKLLSGMITPFASINLTSSQRLLPISSKTRSSSHTNTMDTNNAASHNIIHHDDDKGNMKTSNSTSPGISLSGSNVSVSSTYIASATSPHSLEMCREVVLQRYEELCSALSEVPCEEWINVLCKKANAHLSRQNSYNVQRVNSGREVMEMKNRKNNNINNSNRNTCSKVDSGRCSSGRRSGRNRNKINNNKNKNEHENYHHHLHNRKTSCEGNLSFVNELSTTSTTNLKVEREKTSNKYSEVNKENSEYTNDNNSAKENSASHSNSRITSPMARGRKESSWNKRAVNVEMLYREGANSLMSRGATRLSFHDTLKYVSQYCEQYLQPYVNKMNVIVSQRHAIREAVEKFAQLYNEFRNFCLEMHETRMLENLESNSDEKHKKQQQQQQQQQQEQGYTSKHVRLQHFAEELTTCLEQIQCRVVELLLHIANVSKEIRKPLGTVQLTEQREPVQELQITKPLALSQANLSLQQHQQQQHKEEQVNEQTQEQSKVEKHVISNSNTITSTTPTSENENKEISMSNNNNKNNTVMSSTNVLSSLLPFNATQERSSNSYSNPNINNNNNCSNTNLASTSSMSSSTIMSSRGEGTAVTKGHPFQLPQYELHDVCNLDSAMSSMLSTLAAPAGYTRFVMSQEKEIAHELTSIRDGLGTLLTQAEKISAMPTLGAEEDVHKGNHYNTWEWHLIAIEDVNILKTPLFATNTFFSSTINMKNSDSTNNNTNNSNITLMTMSQHITPPQLLPSRTKENVRKGKDARKRTTSASTSFRMIGNINNNSNSNNNSYSSANSNSLYHKQSQQQMHSLNSSKSSTSADEKRHFVKTPRLCVPSTLSRLTLNTRTNTNNNNNNSAICTAEGNANTTAIHMPSDELVMSEITHNNNNGAAAIPRPPLCPAMTSQTNNNTNHINKKDKDSNTTREHNTNNSAHLSIPVFLVNDISLWLQTSSPSKSNNNHTDHHQHPSSLELEEQQPPPPRWCSVALLKLICKAMPYDNPESITSNETHVELNAAHRTSSNMMTSLVSRGLSHQTNSENVNRPRSRSASVSAGRQARQRSLSVAARYNQSRLDNVMSPYNKSIRANNSSNTMNMNNDSASGSHGKSSNEVEYKIVKLTRVQLQEALNVWEAISSVMKFSSSLTKASYTEISRLEKTIKTTDETPTTMPVEKEHFLQEKSTTTIPSILMETEKKNVDGTNKEMSTTQNAELRSYSGDSENMAKIAQDKQKEQNETKEENKEDINVGKSAIAIEQAVQEQMQLEILLTSNDVKDEQEIKSQSPHTLEEPHIIDIIEIDHIDSLVENSLDNESKYKVISGEIDSMNNYEKELQSEQVSEEKHIQNDMYIEKVKIHAAELIVRAWRVYHARVECARRKEIHAAYEAERAHHAKQIIQYACVKRFLVAAVCRRRFRQKIEMKALPLSLVATAAASTVSSTSKTTNANVLVKENEQVLSTRERFLRGKEQRAKFAFAPVPSLSQVATSNDNKLTCNKEQVQYHTYNEIEHNIERLNDKHTTSQVHVKEFDSDESLTVQTDAQSVKHQSHLLLLEEISKQPLPLMEKGISTNNISHYNIDADSFEVTALHRLLHAPQPLLFLLRVLIDRYPVKPPMGYAPLKETEKASLSTSPARKSLEVTELQDTNNNNSNNKDKNDVNIEISTTDDDDESESSSEESDDNDNNSQASPSVSKSYIKEQQEELEQEQELLSLAQEKQNQITSPKSMLATLCSSPNEICIGFFAFSKLQLLASLESFNEPENKILKLQQNKVSGTKEDGIKEEEQTTTITTTANNSETELLYVPPSNHPALYKSLIMRHELNVPTPVIKPFARPFERWNNAHHVLRRIFCAGAIYAWKLIFSHTPHDDYKQRILQSNEERIARLQRVQQRNQMILACYNVHSERAWMREASADLSFVAQLVSPKRAFDPNDPHFARHCRETYEFVEDFIYQCFPTVSSLDDIPSFLIGAGVYFVLQESLHCEYNALHVNSVLTYLPEHVMEDEHLFTQIKKSNEDSKSHMLNINTRFQHYTIERYEMIRLMQMLCECCHRSNTNSKNEVNKDNEQEQHEQLQESQEPEEEEEEELEEEENDEIQDEHLRQQHQSETKCETNSSSEISSEQRESSEGLSSSKQENTISGAVDHTASTSNHSNNNNTTNIENNASDYAIKEVDVNTKSNADCGRDEDEDDDDRANRNSKKDERAQSKSVSASETIESNSEETHDKNEKRCV